MQLLPVDQIWLHKLSHYFFHDFYFTDEFMNVSEYIKSVVLKFIQVSW